MIDNIMFTTRVITLILSFSICTGHEVFNAEELLQKVVEILEYLVKEKKDQEHQHDEEISAQLNRMKLRLERLENATAVPTPSPTCAPCPNKTYTHCPDGWTRFQGSCYLFVDKTTNFASARTYCHALDAHLVYVESGNENQFLKSHIKTLNDSFYWIGLTDAEREGQFKWDDGKKLVSFTDWENGEPNNDEGVEDCVCMDYRHNYNWNDYPCQLAIKSVCEKAVL